MEENWKGGEQRWPIDDAGLRLGIADIDRTIPVGIAGISASRRSPREEIIENKDAIAHVDCPIPIDITSGDRQGHFVTEGLSAVDEVPGMEASKIATDAIRERDP